MEVKGCRNETTGAISLGNEADKKKIQASGAVRGVSLIRCAFVLLETLFFCVRVVFFFCFFFMRFFKNDKDAHKHGLG